MPRKTLHLRKAIPQTTALRVPLLPLLPLLCHPIVTVPILTPAFKIIATNTKTTPRINVMMEEKLCLLELAAA
jgi:hypothetical protein